MEGGCCCLRGVTWGKAEIFSCLPRLVTNLLGDLAGPLVFSQVESPKEIDTDSYTRDLKSQSGRILSFKGLRLPKIVPE